MDNMKDPGDRHSAQHSSIWDSLLLVATKPGYQGWQLLLLVVVAGVFYAVARPSHISIILGSSGAAAVVTGIVAVAIERVLEVTWWMQPGAVEAATRATKAPESAKTPETAKAPGADDAVADPRRLLISIELGVLLGLGVARLLGINVFYGCKMDTPIASVGWQWGVAMTGLMMGLVAQPVHLVMRTVDTFKENQKETSRQKRRLQGK